MTLHDHLRCAGAGLGGLLEGRGAVRGAEAAGGGGRGRVCFLASGVGLPGNDSERARPSCRDAAPMSRRRVHGMPRQISVTTTDM